MDIRITETCVPHVYFLFEVLINVFRDKTNVLYDLKCQSLQYRKLAGNYRVNFVTDSNWFNGTFETGEARHNNFK